MHRAGFLLTLLKVANTYREAWIYWKEIIDCGNAILEGILFNKECYKSQNKYEKHLPEGGRVIFSPWIALLASGLYFYCGL